MLGLILVLIAFGITAVKTVIGWLRGDQRERWPIGAFIYAAVFVFAIATFAFAWTASVVDAADVIAGREPPRTRTTTTVFVPPTFTIPAFTTPDFPTFTIPSFPPPTLRQPPPSLPPRLTIPDPLSP